MLRYATQRFVPVVRKQPVVGYFTGPSFFNRLLSNPKGFDNFFRRKPDIKDGKASESTNGSTAEKLGDDAKFKFNSNKGGNSKKPPENKKPPDAMTIALMAVLALGIMEVSDRMTNKGT